MKDGPSIAGIAALLGDPARANMLTCLMDGRALTVTELAVVAGVALPTASEHLSRLRDAGLLRDEKQGRRRYFRLSGPDVAQILEGLMGLAQRTGATRTRTGPREPALRAARVCYDHLAGERAVAMTEGLLRRGLIDGDDEPRVTPDGRLFFSGLGIDMGALEARRRPLCRFCLDWSERRSHLAGALGAAVLDHLVQLRWASRGEHRLVTFTPAGLKAFGETFAAAPPPP